MGNSNSSSDSDEDPRGDNNEDDDIFSETDGEAAGKDEVVPADLNNLFDSQLLRNLAAKIRDEMPTNMTQQHHNAIIRWLYERPETQETVSAAQFTDMLMSKGFSRLASLRMFQEFDTDGSGVADVTTIIDALQMYSNGTTVQGEIGKSIRMLQAYALTPGFVDVYTGDQNPIPQHGEKILKYLLRNRADSRTIPFSELNGFNNTCNMRLSVLKSVFDHLKNSGGADVDDQELGNGEELRPITKCYTSIEVSTNTSDAYKLTNGDPNTFWQSDGTARSHWIRLHMKNNSVLKVLSIYVASSDKSYIPELVTVSAGRNPRNLREIKEVRIPSNTTGEFVLLKNIKVYYPVVQINIKRCYSDGCDTRIHNLKAIAYRIVKEPGISVLDASATWYLQILTSLVGATLPQSPQLREMVISHTKSALTHMPPLSLCPASSDRPHFLSRHVLQELDKFIMEMSVEDGQIQPEGLHLLLALNLARGHVAKLIEILKYFYGQQTITLKCTELLSSAMEAKNNCWEKLGGLIPMTVLGCEPGKESVASLIVNYTTESSKQVFITDEGKTKLDLFFTSKNYVQFTKFRIKIPSGGKGPRRGLIFVFNHTGDFNYAEQVKNFEKYDTWRDLEYKFSVNVRSAGVGGKPDNPVSYFHFDDDCDEMDISASWHPVGKIVLVKLLEPRQASANKIGVMSIKFFGFPRKVQDLNIEKLSVPVLNPEKQPLCNSLEITQCILTFLVDLSVDQVKKRGKVSQVDYLDFQGVDIETMWTLYKLFKDSEIKGWVECSKKMLKLIHGLTPVIVPLSDSAKSVSDEMFQYLCDVIDNDKISKTSQIYLSAEQLIIDGASLFFPNKEMKRERLFKMLANVDNLTTAPSVVLVFQSLCQFFSSVDPEGLLDLPKVLSEDFNIYTVLDVMKTLIVVASEEFSITSSEDSSNEQMTYLIQLTGSLQSSLLSWCSRQFSYEDPTVTRIVTNMINEYTCHVGDRAVQLAQTLVDHSSSIMEKMADSMQPAFLSSVVRQLVLILDHLCDKLDTKTKIDILDAWTPLLLILDTVVDINPKLRRKISGEKFSESKTDDIILRTWEIESSHNYENNSNISQMFYCPGASMFVLDFDPRCETERRYDYLEFTDGKGISRKFDQKVGNPKWPKQVVFSGPNLQFLFRSDGSNTEWGYKFVVTAKGTPDAPLSWPYDLVLSWSKLLGNFCGSMLSSNPGLYAFDNVEGTFEQDVLHSELWTSLFRGGYMVGKYQRSLSCKMETEESIHLNTFFTDVIEKRTETATELLKKCQENKINVNKVGGEDVDEAVACVFCALIWHTQNLREDMERYVRCNGDMAVPDGVVQAYHTAESLRMSLIFQRQKIKSEGETISPESDPVAICKKDALYLLKFAGLTKVQLKNDMRSKFNKQSLKKKGNKKSDLFVFKTEVYDKYPSFRLVMEFIQDMAWTTDLVDDMLNERSVYASAACDVYEFMTNIQVLTSPIALIMFFQELFSHQEKFPLHYADGLEGCGLEQESKVRRAYYMFVRKFSEILCKGVRPEPDSELMPRYRYLQVCLLHFLDTQWKPYDLSFVSEIQLPELLLKIAKETVKMRNCAIMEENESELKEYKQCMTWLEECKDGFASWYRSEDANKERRKDIQMFVARFCDLLDVDISCDGCNNTLPGRRYRCMQCVDMDLCTTCFSGGVKPEGEHKDDHEIVHLVFKCNYCQGFIIDTRIHCNICEDFDLCLGCHTDKKFPAEHSELHSVTKIPPVRLKTEQAMDSVVQAYIHQHVWLLFTSLSLLLGEIIHSDSSVDSDYIKLAAELQNKCITLCTECLEKVPDAADDGSKHLLQDGSQSLETRQEEAFAFHSQERIMGLLGAMIPLENKSFQKLPKQGVTYNFTTKEFLNLLFKVARGDHNQELNTQHLGMGLLGRLLTRSSPTVSDAAVAPFITVKSTLASTPGQDTVKYLFNFGASCLEKSGIEWACSMACILASLSNAPQWKSIVCDHVSRCIQTLKQKKIEKKMLEKSKEGEITENTAGESKSPTKTISTQASRKKPELSSIFAMFVMAGFPEVLTIGNQVTYNHKTLEKKRGIVIKNFPNKCQTLVVNVDNRKRHTVKDHCVTCTGETVQLWDPVHVTEFTSIITEICAQIKQEEVLEVETLWVLSLALKVLQNYVKTTEHYLDEKMFEGEFIRCLVHLASQGTGFNQQWLLKDLEVLSLMLYTHDRSRKIPSTMVKIPKTTEKDVEKPKLMEIEDDTEGSEDSDDSEDIDEDEDDDDDTSSSTSSSLKSASLNSSPEDDEGFKNVDPKTKALFQALHVKLNVPASVLLVIYEMHEGNRDSVIKAIIENCGHSDEIKSFVENWELGGKEPEKNSEKIIDRGIQLSPTLVPTDDENVSKTPLKERKCEKATEEKGDTQINLIPLVSVNQGRIGELRQTKSTELLRKELSKYGRSGSREFLSKVNMAMSIIFSRNLLRGLLACWPAGGPTITCNLLGCTEPEQIPCILDLLHKMDGLDNFSKVVEKVVMNCDEKSLVPIACKACQFMEEMPIASVTHETEHNYRSGNKRGKIQFPGASFLTVTFDSRCSLMEGMDTLIFSVSDDPDKRKYTFTGHGKSRWTSFQVAGDVLNYKFNCETLEPITDFWGYKFTVTAGSRDSFETGYSILDFILSSKDKLNVDTLPLTELWLRLVYIACIQTGTQRLQAVQLLLKIINHQPASLPPEDKRLNFDVLSPLWKLYTDLTKADEDPAAILPPVVRALTEFFLHVENLVQAWGLAIDYLVAVMDLKDLRKTCSQGMINIAAVSTMINYENSATDFIKLSKKLSVSKQQARVVK